MHLILISGLSGSGKSIALNVLEDAAYYCVDNLPVALLPRLVESLAGSGYDRVAVAADMRSGTGIAGLPEQLRELGKEAIDLILADIEGRHGVARLQQAARHGPAHGAEPDESDLAGHASLPDRMPDAVVYTPPSTRHQSRRW